MGQMTKLARSVVTVLLLAMTLAVPARVAWADETDAPTDAKTQEAMRHFERGLQLYNEGAFEAALVEFERAYQLAPSYRILYNEARIHRAMNRYADALTKFERYLKEGGDDIEPSRREEVTREIEQLRPRVASIDVKTNLAGADVFVDDVAVGLSPVSRAVIVNPGMRKVTVSKKGYLPATKVIRVVGSDAVQVTLDLVPMQGPREKPTDPGPRNRAIVGWAVTSVFTGAAIVTGVMALNRSKSLDEAKEVPNQDSALLESEHDKLVTLTVLTDVFAGAAVIAGATSIYLTYKAVKAGGRPAPKTGSASVGLRPGGVNVAVSF